MKRRDAQIKGMKIGILAGGDSSERDVSLRSGKAVLDVMLANGVDAVMIDVDPGNFLAEIVGKKIDLAFLALHGRFGEDGTIQRILGSNGIMYTGSGPAASALAIDKIASKDRFLKYGLRVPEHKTVRSIRDLAREKIWYPCVVKPRYEGSSIGLSVVAASSDIEKAVSIALKYGEDVMIERFIPGRELTIGVIGDESLPVVEIVAEEGVYDYTAKYRSKSTRYVVPAEISRKEFVKAQEAGLAAHRALGCEGFSRTDLRLAPEGEVYVLEVNTLPGLTERSLLPMAAKAAGLDFYGLCVKMVSEAVNRSRD